MARPQKPGLDYFQVDVDIYEDDKIILAQELIDPDGKRPWERFSIPGMAIRMLREIFKEGGYYKEFNDRVALAISSKMNSVITLNLLKEIVDCLLRSGFFNSEIYNKYGVLTSHGIQKRWLFICKNAKRKNISLDSNILLIPELIGLTPEETPLTPEETPSYGSKNPHKKYTIINNISIGNKGKRVNTQNVNNVVDDVKTPEETPLTPEETPLTPEETPLTPEETPLTPEETPLTPEETPLTPEETIRQHLDGPMNGWHDIDHLLEFYFSANKMIRTREQVAMSNHMDINILREWANSFNRFLITEGTTQKQKEDWPKHFKNWLAKQDKNQNPNKLFNENSSENGKQNSKSASDKPRNGHQPFDMDSAISKIDYLLGLDEHKRS